jgi:superfamily II DNA helicase RecQ
MTAGLTLVVSPLISLMQDQVGALRRRGIAAA